MTPETLTIDQVPFYQRGYPELDEVVLEIAKIQLSDCIEIHATNKDKCVEYDEKNAGNPFAYFLRPTAIDPIHLWGFRMRNSIPPLVEWHKASLGKQTYMIDGSLNPDCKDPQKWE